LATASFSSVYRRLKKKGLIKEHHLKISKHKKGRPTATYAHEIWLVDITFVPVGNGFWYLIAVIDLYSRYIVGWDLSATMTSKDVQKVIDFALLQYGFYEKEDKPKIHSDNGSQMKAKSFKAFLKDLGILNEYSRPHVPEDQAVLERFFRTIKQGEVYHQEYENHYQAKDGISEFINYYNHRRPHQGIGFITPYEKLTGQKERIFKERKTRAIVAQEMRKIMNRRKMNTDTSEVMTPVKNRNKKIFRLGPKGSETVHQKCCFYKRPCCIFWSREVKKRIGLYTQQFQFSSLLIQEYPFSILLFFFVPRILFLNKGSALLILTPF
ncbi:MAG: IS3 family transposase, partial [Candidatus Aerophobetes bacterium]|nr:IS3 family transposase [Candidatus Aerophobetes bacterium]